MKREILFRGKAIRNTFSINKDEAEIKIGDWVYGAVIPFDDGIDLIYERDPNNPKICGCHGIDVDHNTVGQYTGLHDCNGKEIYEGDLLGTKESNHYLEVRYLDGGFRLCGTDDDTGRGSIPIHYLINNINLVIEVIGNVHEK